jgi:NAD(P)-dependent dehydrogenase (short-subunit alcohol dehydrogenase family)
MQVSMTRFAPDQWALILGGSSGFGLASAKKLAAEGMSVGIVHRDRRGAMDRVTREFDEIRAHGHGFFGLNLDALSLEGMATVVDTLATHLGTAGRVRVLLHSVAYGNLKPVVAGPRPDRTPALARLAEALGLPAADVTARPTRWPSPASPSFSRSGPWTMARRSSKTRTWRGRYSRWARACSHGSSASTREGCLPPTPAFLA